MLVLFVWVAIHEKKYSIIYSAGALLPPRMLLPGSIVALYSVTYCAAPCRDNSSPFADLVSIRARGFDLVITPLSAALALLDHHSRPNKEHRDSLRSQHVDLHPPVTPALPGTCVRGKCER
jgi:hypothetical protein